MKLTKMKHTITLNSIIHIEKVWCTNIFYSCISSASLEKEIKSSKQGVTWPPSPLRKIDEKAAKMSLLSRYLIGIFMSKFEQFCMRPKFS